MNLTSYRSARFKSIVESHGLTYKDGKVSKAGNTNAIATKAPAAKDTNAGTPKTPKGRDIKRKAGADGGDCETPSGKKGSAKKAKKSQPIIKEEDEPSDEDVPGESGESDAKDSKDDGAEEGSDDHE